jgi:hypothetical protein
MHARLTKNGAITCGCHQAHALHRTRRTRLPTISKLFADGTGLRFRQCIRHLGGGYVDLCVREAKVEGSLPRGIYGLEMAERIIEEWR